MLRPPRIFLFKKNKRRGCVCGGVWGRAQGCHVQNHSPVVLVLLLEPKLADGGHGYFSGEKEAFSYV